MRPQWSERHAAFVAGTGTFGIHGAPDPRLIGKRASHGCVRLTNWDAAELGSAIRKGTVVVFQGAEKTFKA